MVNNKSDIILLTGVTGLLGRHVLYELLREIVAGRLSPVIFLLVRDKGSASAEERLLSVFDTPSLPRDLAAWDVRGLASHIRIIEADMRSPDLREKIEEQLPVHGSILCVNMAASTNLFANDQAIKEIYENNFHGTTNLFQSLRSYSKKFIFVSTAYATGLRSGFIVNEIDRKALLRFRTPYEYYKHLTENELVHLASLTGDEIQILRPSVICGRLVDAPLHFTSKFDVFYGWGKYFFRMKESGRKERLRVFINADSGLNVVPVDYAAKAVVRAMRLRIIELNLAHSRCIPHRNYLSSILDAVGYKGVEFVDEMPENLSRSERLYYSTAGAAFTPYLTSPSHEFDTRVLREIMNDAAEPDVEHSFPGLIGYAMDHGFECIDDRSREPVACST
jgi:nucleoside-diphosphate-sugar epimerase